MPYRSYYNHQISWFKNLKNFFFTTAPLSREGYFVGITSLFYISLALVVILSLFIPLYSLITLCVTNPDESHLFTYTFIPLIIVALCLILIVGLMSIMLNIRRLHDLGDSGWWAIPLYILFFIPGVSFFWLIYALVKPGKKAGNLYGPRREEGTAILYRYYDPALGYWQNIKNFYFRIQGRLNRLPYFWGTSALNLATGIIIGIITIPLILVFISNFITLSTLDVDLEHLSNDLSSRVFILTYLLIFIISMANGIATLLLKIRRFHDLNFATLWIIPYLFASFVPVLNYLIIFVDVLLYFKQGTKGNNKFGEDPLAINP